MRVVEYASNTESFTYRVIRGIGVIAAFFSIVVCALLIANNLSLKSADPIHSKALEQRLVDMKADPGNQAIKEEIRELDYIARRAFFTSQHFNRMGIYFLVGGLVVTLTAFKSLAAYREQVPYPDSRDPKDDLVETAKWARKSVTIAGLVLIGFALVLALPWESPLDDTNQLDTATSSEPAVPPPLASPEEMARHWPAFRGMTAGVAGEGETPVDWDGESGRGITWKTPVPRPGFSSPIVWENRIYMTGGDKEVREVYCFGSAKGELLWTHRVAGIPGSPAKPPKVSSDTGYAAPTMTTDGLRLFAIFSTGDLVALDFEGNRVWGRNLGVPQNPYGHSSSLVRYEDVLLVQYDQEEGSFFAGVDVATGSEKWKVKRDFGPSWASPILADTGERTEAILAAGTLTSYNPKTGEQYWSMEWVDGGEIAPTPVYADGMLYVSCGYIKISAIDLKTQKVVWENNEQIPGVCTPLVNAGLLIAGLDDGGIACFDAKTGVGVDGESQELWVHDTDEGFYASPIMVGGKVYLIDRIGTMHIFGPGREYKPLGQAQLGEEAVCTPAVVGNAIYYRGISHLFKIAP